MAVLFIVGVIIKSNIASENSKRIFQVYEKSRVRASPVIVFIELLLTMINFVDGRERVNSKDNFDANPSVKAAEFTKVLH